MRASRAAVDAVAAVLRRGLGAQIGERRVLEEARLIADVAVERLGATPAAQRAAEAWVARRVDTGEPVQYVLGSAWFWTLELEVGPGVLVPRPCSEILVESAVAALAAGDAYLPEREQVVVDLGTGPGTLLLATLSERPQARGLGIDLSETALSFARRNAVKAGLDGRCTFVRANFGEPLAPTLAREGVGAIDVLISNPPYIRDDEVLDPLVAEHEPHIALFAGPDGLAGYRAVAARVAELRETGALGDTSRVVVEAGEGQAESIRGVFSDIGARWLRTRRDLREVERCLEFAVR